MRRARLTLAFHLWNCRCLCFLVALVRLRCAFTRSTPAKYEHEARRNANMRGPSCAAHAPHSTPRWSAKCLEGIRLGGPLRRWEEEKNKVFCIMEMDRHRTTPWREQALTWLRIQWQMDQVARCKISVLNVVDLCVCASSVTILKQIYSG